VVIELQVEHPLLDVRVFLNRTFLTSVVLVAVMFVSLSAMIFYVPLFLQNVQGYTPSHTGLILLPQVVVLVICMPLGGRLFDLIGARWPALAGTLLAGTGLLLLSRLNTDITVEEVILGQCITAAGLGISMMPVQTGALTALRGQFGESGNSFNTLSQRVSQAFGVALLTAMVSADKEQFFADRSALVDARGANADPRITEMARQGSGGLLSLWQEYSNQAQTMAYSKTFLIVGYLALAATALVFLLPTGRPTATDGEKPVVH
jgi:MFS family permease